MRNTKTTINKFLIFSLLILSVFSLAFTPKERNDNSGKGSNGIAKTQNKAGDAYLMQINNIKMPMNRTGVMANVNVSGVGQGEFGGNGFLFSGGFLMSGLANGVLWANGVATASRIQDYDAGTYNEGGATDPRAQMYVVDKADPPFGQSWQDWKDAVALGADFYDGDGDGKYNPIDLNGNGEWDADEDAPDQIGDETVWTVYSDQIPSGKRRFTEVNPVGIEIRQSVSAFQSAGSLGNIIFVRYRLRNTGLVADVLDSVYFGVWADPDLGDFTDDLVGSDTTLDAGYVYNDGNDANYGSNPPTFLIDFFQGPVAFVPGKSFDDANGNGVFDPGETPLDTALKVKGQILGVDTIPGATNLGISSFVHYMQSHPTQGDPNTAQEARNYNLGFDRVGNLIDPCTWTFGSVQGGVDCAAVDPKFMYSGNPVTGVGWINILPTDQRQMSNTGPFKLVKSDDPNNPGKNDIDIVAAYIVGRGNSALNSIDEAKKISNFAQFIYDQNFKTAAPPPDVKPIVKTEDEAIELIWNASEQMKYHSQAFDAGGNSVFNVLFEGFQVWMFNKNSTSLEESGQANAKLIASYDKANNINTVLIENGNTKERTTTYTPGIQLDSALYSDPERGWIKLRITKDPFTSGPILKGKPYFIAIVGYALNYDALVALDAQAGTWMLRGDAFTQATQNVFKIINNGIIPGDDANIPSRSGIALAHTGPAESVANYTVIDRSSTTTAKYKVNFFKDSSDSKYSLFWKATNESTGQVVVDSSKAYNLIDPTTLVDGVLLNIKWVKPGLKDASFQGGEMFNKTQNDNTGPFYVGKDLDTVMFVSAVTTGRTGVIHAEDMRRVEIRFGQTSKAYRYLKGNFSLNFLSPDPSDPTKGSNFVEVPYQVWVKDDNYGEERQLATGVLEVEDNSKGLAPDEKWNPGTDISLTKEYIVIFNAPYDDTGSQVVYTGTGTGPRSGKFAIISKGYKIDRNDPRVNDSLIAIAKEPWFNAMYVVGLEAKDSVAAANWNPTGTYVIDIPHPLTDKDEFTYQVSKDLTAAEQTDRFNKVNVFPNPLFAFNPATSFTGGNIDEPFVTFSNLPNQVTIKIYSLSGIVLRTLTEQNKTSITSPYLRWDLKNEDGLRVASGVYIAVISNPTLGDKILKFAIIQPQKQIQRF